MERRENERTVRRIPVRFWERGDHASHGGRGYATNLSTGGLYLATATPFTSGTRLRLEIGAPPTDFVVEGVVAHSRRLAPELRRLGLAGMGVRFVTVEEMVIELMGGAAVDPGPGSEAAPDGVYRMRFDSTDQFLRVARTDVVHGGLFVPTRRPAALDERVVVEVELPVRGLHPVRLPARVVQRIEPEEVGGKPNLLAGMGVQLEDPTAARKAFEPALEALTRRG